MLEDQWFNGKMIKAKKFSEKEIYFFFLMLFSVININKQFPSVFQTAKNRLHKSNSHLISLHNYTCRPHLLGHSCFAVSICLFADALMVCPQHPSPPDRSTANTDVSVSGHFDRWQTNSCLHCTKNNHTCFLLLHSPV